MQGLCQTGTIASSCAGMPVPGREEGVSPVFPHRDEERFGCGAPNPGRRHVNDGARRRAVRPPGRSDDQREHRADRHDGNDGGEQGLGQGVDHARISEMAPRDGLEPPTQ